MNSYREIDWCDEHQSAWDEYGQCERMTIGKYPDGYHVVTDCRRRRLRVWQ